MCYANTAAASRVRTTKMSQTRGFSIRWHTWLVLNKENEMTTSLLTQSATFDNAPQAEDTGNPRRWATRGNLQKRCATIRLWSAFPRHRSVNFHASVRNCSTLQLIYL